MCDKISRQFWGEVLLGPSSSINYLRWQVSYHGNAIIVSTIVLAGPQLAFLLECCFSSLSKSYIAVLQVTKASPRVFPEVYRFQDLKLDHSLSIFVCHFLEREVCIINHLSEYHLSYNSKQ